MAVNKDPILKRCRYLGISPAVMGVSKKESIRFKNANNRKKISEYGLQLKEKQKLKFIYGVLEKQFYHYFEIASKMEGKTGDNLITCLESRLDSVVYRMGLALTRREARQLVVHNHYTVNGKKVNIPSYRVKVGDVIALAEKDKTSEKFKSTVEATNGRVVPMWLNANKDNFSASVVRMPSAEDIDYEVAAHLIVELYSK
ncbi:MAG: 30S ribosomal protein S4 [Ruminococcus sp.]|jgi:small subunit ribosomal protein S4|nr:30S ribosomal protein S4 [Ruminococcus sp.]CDF01305.1 30S ribosomal protein S4 [Ruminococcus sp. CAG:624]MCI6888562.1 30S ribosomal protein S4 [Ruminococcus sp.]MDD6634576.1 30S ribosomal protein S4 [Ruminococcus sp.]MDY3214357.1 30S ribosomal protein S4 [Ruminococcus sp.]